MTKKLKILMCCHLPLNPKLGGAKVYIEAAETYRYHGHEVELVGVEKVTGENEPYMNESWRLKNYPSLLKNFLEKNKIQYDVIELEAPYLLEKPLLENRPLIVARSVLLDLHLREISIPRFKGLRSFLGHILKGPARRKVLEEKINQSLLSMRNADLINVPNPSDAKTLMSNGFSAEKIIIQPYGIFLKRWEHLSSAQQGSKSNKVAFVGTFDNRKGAVEFPIIMKWLLKKIPNIKFKFLGVLAMFPNSEAIQKYLGPNLSESSEIVSTFAPEELHKHLADCKVGLFPSYLESFGFGVLEMMASGIPVVGYDSPGINMMINPDLLVKPGDAEMCAKKICLLLEDENFYDTQKSIALTKAKEFIYENQKNVSLETYLKLVSKL